MEPAHPELCSFWDGNQSSPRRVRSCLEGDGYMAAEADTHFTVCLHLHHQFSRMLPLGLQRRQPGPSMGDLGDSRMSPIGQGIKVRESARRCSELQAGASLEDSETRMELI